MSGPPTVLSPAAVACNLNILATHSHLSKIWSYPCAWNRGPLLARGSQPLVCLAQREFCFVRLAGTSLSRGLDLYFEVSFQLLIGNF